MSRYQRLFESLSRQNKGAFIPFVTIGDPSPDCSFDIIKTLIDAGADALELGIPFSDPLADGPTIQNANLRAFAGGINVNICFDILKKVRAINQNIPIGLLVYANLVFRAGLDSFYQKCADAGVDSVLIADVPLNESEPFKHAAIKNNIEPIFICPPNADESTIKNIAKHGKGYTYLVSRAGVTGTESAALNPLTHLIDLLKKHSAPPAIQGFGISTPMQVHEVINSGAMGAIAGSATVKIIEDNLNNKDEMLKKLALFVQEMKAKTNII